MAAPIIAAGIAALASLGSGLMGIKAQKKAQKKQMEQEAVNRAFDSQMAANQQLNQTTQQSLAQLMQGYQNILR